MTITKILTTLGAAMLAALALAAPASAAVWESCGTIRASVDGVPSTIAVWGISPSGALSCATARRVARVAIRQAFPGGRMRVGHQAWYGRDYHTSADSFTITYKRGRNAVQLDTSY